MSAMSDFLENKIIDQLFRGQAAPTTTTLQRPLIPVVAPRSLVALTPVWP